MFQWHRIRQTWLPGCFDFAQSIVQRFEHVGGCHGIILVALDDPRHVNDCMAVVSAKVVPLRSAASQRPRPISQNPRRCTMAVTVKKIVVWQTQVQNKPGGL